MFLAIGGLEALVMRVQLAQANNHLLTPAQYAKNVKPHPASKEYVDFMASRGFGVAYLGPDEFGRFMAKADADLGATMKAVGIAK